MAKQYHTNKQIWLCKELLKNCNNIPAENQKPLVFTSRSSSFVKLDLLIPKDQLWNLEVTLIVFTWYRYCPNEYFWESGDSNWDPTSKIFDLAKIRVLFLGMKFIPKTKIINLEKVFFLILKTSGEEWTIKCFSLSKKTPWTYVREKAFRIKSLWSCMEEYKTSTNFVLTF